MTLNIRSKLNLNAINALMATASLEAMRATNTNDIVQRLTAAPVYRMPPIKELEKRWGEFKTHFGLYEAVYDSYRYLGLLLTSREFTRAISGFYNDKTASGVSELLKALNRKDNDYYFMDVGAKAIQTKMSFNNIDLTLDPRRDPQSVMDGETILKSLFPTFKSPTKWEKQTVEDGNTKRTTISVGEDLVNTIPLENFLKITPHFTSTNDKIKPADLKFGLAKKYFDNNFNKIASIKLTLKQSDIVLRDNSGYIARSTETTGPLGDGSYIPKFEVEVEAIFNWPLEFAYYVTCANGPTDFLPFLFFQYISWHKAVYSGGRTRGGGFGSRPTRINNLGNIVARNAKEQAAGRNPKARINKDGFLTIGVGESSETGNVYWIPSNVNKVVDYVSQIKSAYNGEQKRIDLTAIKLKGEGLYTDWFNEKFTYIREEGTRASSADISGLHTLDLVGSVPLDNITIYKNLDAELSPLDLGEKSEFEWYLSVVRKFLQGDMKNRGAEPSKPYATREYLEKMGFIVQRITDQGNMKDYLSSVVNRWLNRGLKFGWANIGGQPLTLHVVTGDDLTEAKNPDDFKDIRVCFNFLKEVSADFLNQLDKVDIGYINKLGKLRYILFMILNYAPRYNDFKAEHDEKIRQNQIVGISDAVYKAALDNIELPNLPGIDRLMPHQLETTIEMTPPPAASLTEVSAGGGKTVIELAEMAQMLYKGDINRAIVVVPGNLVRNWVNEIQNFSKGQINAFALNINSLRRLQYVYNQNTDPVQKPDYPMLKKIVEDLPKNTIIVTSYRFLANDRERVVYGNKVITRYYIAEFLRDLGFDMVALDESHTAKNLASNTTMATSILLSPAKYKRELSGTAVFDNVGDLVGQSGIMVPPALGSKSRFMENFAEGGDWDTDAPSKITDAMRPYIKRITHKRHKWAAMLPQLIESFRVVNMTEKQSEFYNSLLESELDRIKRENPKLYARLMDGNDKDAKAIEAGLATYFQAVEQFLYAPDSNEAFAQLEGLQPSDLVSPKIEAIVNILNDHFNGYKDDLGRTHAGDTHKVIIFSHRRKTSEHVFRHLPANYQKMAVRYEAGDYQALQQFLVNPKTMILVADELSINTGQNLQIASRMIRLETLWSPGAQEQAIARIWRPAFKEGSDRQKVYMNWIYTNMSLEVTKIGRLISKIITKTRYDQQDNDFFVKTRIPIPTEFNRRWGNQLPGLNVARPVNDMLASLPLLKMNIKTLTTLNNARDLEEYFANYSLLNLWEEREFDRLKSELRYTAPVMVPKSAYKTIPGSKTIPYMPRVPGVDPVFFDTDNKMGFRPISVIQEKASDPNDTGEDDEGSDDDDDNTVDVIEVDTTTIVNTEFGYGRITKILKTDVWVDVVGVGEVKVPKTTAWVITNKDEENKIIRQLTQGDPKSNVKLPAPVMSAIKTRLANAKPADYSTEDEEDDIAHKASPVKNEPVDEYDEEDEEDKVLPIWASIVDTQIALNTQYDSDSEFLVDEEGWKIINPYLSIQVPTAAALEKILTKLQSKYQINSPYIKNLEYYKTMLLNHSLDVAQPNMVNQTMRFFGQTEHKRLNDKALRPFPIIWDGHLYIAIDKQQTPAWKAVMQDVKALGIPNLHIINQTEMTVKFFTNKDTALEELEKLNKMSHNPYYAEARKVLENVKIKRNTVPTVAPKQTSVVPRFEKAAPQEKPTLKLNLKKKPEPVAAPAPKLKVNTGISPQTKKPAFKINLKGLTKIK